MIPPSLKCHFDGGKSLKASEEIRKRLGIPKGNGTVVTIEVNSRFKIRRHEKFIGEFSRYYSLRDILSHPEREVTLVDLTQKREDRLTYRYPTGQVVYDNDFVIPDYPDAKAHLTIQRHDTSFARDQLPYREGILIKSGAGIHDCTYFNLESEPYAWRFTDELRCDYIDQLVKEYEDREEANPDTPNHPANNPTRLLDPLRDGLIGEHPFAQNLYKKCAEILRSFINDLKATDAATRRDVTDESLKRKLNDLSREVSKLFETKLKELEEEEFPFEKGEMENLSIGLHIIPPGDPMSIVVNQPKTFSITVKHSEILDQSLTVDVTSSEPDDVTAHSSPIPLKRFSEDGKIGKTTFTLEGLKVGGEAYIEVRCGIYDKLFCAQVVEPPPAQQIPDGLTFERPRYELQINKEKTLILRLKTKSDLSGQVIAEISSDHPEIVVKGGGRCELKRTSLPNIWTGLCRVEGRQLKARGTITARVRRLEPAQARVIVGEHEPKSGMLLKPPIPVEDDFGSLRYKWDEPNDRYQLLIGARHPSIRRYLGEPQGSDYPGVTSPLYHAILAEVIAEALTFKILQTVFTKKGRDGSLLDYSETDYHFHRHFSDFLAIAHRCLVTNPEFK